MPTGTSNPERGAHQADSAAHRASQLIVIDQANGLLHGASDPRGGGAAVGH